MEINSIIISTIDREPEYIHQTLACLLFTLKEKKEIYLVVDGPSYKNYEIYKNYCKILLNKRSEEPVAHKRAKYNYIRCLELSRSLGGLNLIMEDDIVLLKGWQDRIKEINLEGHWVLSLNCAQNFISLRGYEEFIAVDCENNKKMVWNKTFAVIYGESVLSFVINLLKDDLDIPHDIMIGGFLSFSSVKIYETVPTIVEHIGNFSSIDPTVYWKSGKIREGLFNYEPTLRCK
jgi:glycosyltransferase involved in cell wall biosynthesis